MNNSWIDSTVPCIGIVSATSTAVQGAATDFTYETTASGGTIVSLSVDPGDGGAMVAATGGPDTWVANITYATAGTYQQTITYVDSVGNSGTFTSEVEITL